MERGVREIVEKEESGERMRQKRERNRGEWRREKVVRRVRRGQRAEREE